MSRRKAALGFAAGAAVLAALSFGLVAIQAGVTETVRIGSTSASEAGEASISVEALGIPAPGLGAWSMDISYDPGVVTATGCSPQNGSVCNPAYDSDTVRLVGANAQGLEGDSLLGTISFRCESAGSTSLSVVINGLSDATPGDLQPIDAVTENGSVSCAGAAQAGPTIAVGSASAATGANASVELTALDMEAPGLGAWTLDVSYDPNVISAVDCTPSNGGVCNPNFDGDTMRVTGANADGLEGDATLATLTFLCGDDVASSALEITAQVLVDATVGDPQPISANKVGGAINCVEEAGATATPTATPPSGAPVAGTGFTPGGTGGPFDWFVAGLIGAGIAWVIAGLAGARFAMASASRGAPQAPIAARNRAASFRPELRPARFEGAARPAAREESRAVQPQSRAPRSGRRSWFASALDELPGVADIERFRRRTKR